MLKVFRGRIVVKLAILIVILAIPTAFALLAVRGFVVRNAVVTAELSMVRAPMAGQVVESPASAQPATDGLAWQVTVRDPPGGASPVEILITEIDGVESAIEVQQANLHWHDQAIAEQEAELRAAIAGMQRVLDFEADAVRADIAAQQVRIAYLEARNARLGQPQGPADAQASPEEWAAELEEARANLASLRATGQGLEQQGALLDDRLPIADFGGLGAILIGHLNDLAIARQAIAVRLADLENTRSVLQSRLESQQHGGETESEPVLTASPGSVIWEVFAEPGAFVERGTPLFATVNCDHRLVQLAVDDATTELISPGHAVEVHLYGDRAPISGTVRSIYGSGGHATELASLAAHISNVGLREAIVLIDIEPADEASRQYRHCDIGRTAYVAFDGIGAIEPFLNRF